jgi:uncharacterized protein (TIGR01777 family)
MRVFITGGSGLVGTRLIHWLRQRQDEVIVLTRRPEIARQKLDAACVLVEGDPMQAGEWQRAIEPCDAVVNLAGENIFGRRWNAAFKEMLADSRVNSTRQVIEALGRNPKTAGGSPKTLVNASAIGYYGPHGDEELTEDSPPGDDVLARVCIAWEEAARGAEALGVRLAILRIGIVFAKEGGALAQMLTPFRLFAGGPVGSGKQYMSWIHIDDLVRLILVGLDRPEARGPINATAPAPVTNKEFARALGRVLHRPSFMRTPRFMLRVMVGEAADVIATGQRVLPCRAGELGFTFKFPEVEGALRDLVLESGQQDFIGPERGSTP